jgi:PAS domain S-box-containing protein
MRKNFSPIYFVLLVWMIAFVAVIFVFDEVTNTYQKAIIIVAFGIINGLIFNFFSLKQVVTPRAWLTIRLKELTSGRISKKKKFDLPKGYQIIQKQFEKLEEDISKSNLSLQKMMKGESPLSEMIDSTMPLHQQIVQLYQSIETQHKSTDQTQWYRQGYAQINDVLRQSTKRSPQELAQKLLEEIANYFDAQQGAIYWIEEKEENQELQLAAAYACPIEKIQQKSFGIKEGLIGTCFSKNKAIILDKLPPDYPHLTTSFNQFTAKSLVIYPIQKEGQVLGVLELISYQPLANYQQELLQAVCEIYAITLESQRMHLNTEWLLEDAQYANTQLKQREVQMNKNSEQLEQMQEMLSERIKVIEEETNLLNNILEAIDKTNATIEFDMAGNILEVNDMYLSVVGYQHEELIGQNETILVPQDDIATGRYDMIWDSLRQGSYLSGEYRRITQGGKEVWLDSTYNPIFDTEGVPFKVIQLAQFTTEDKERNLEQTSKLNALGQALPIIELNEEGYITRINAKFTSILGYERKDIRKQPFENFIINNQKEFIAKIFADAWQGEMQTRLFTILSKENNEHQTIVYFNPIMKLDGSTDKLLVTLIDVTEIESMRLRLINNEKKISKTITELNDTTTKLHQQNKEFDTVVNMFHQACKAFELDNDFQLVSINQNLQNKLLLKPKDNLSRFEELIDPHFPMRYWEECKEHLKLNDFHRFTLKYRSPSGKSFWGNTSIAVYRDFEKKQTRYLGIIIDVTDDVIQAVYLRGEIVELKMKNAILDYKNINKDSTIDENGLVKSALEADTDTLKEMINHELLPSMRANQDGIITVANPLVYDLLGHSKEALIGKELSHIFSFKNQDEQQNYQEWLHNNNNQKLSGIKIINNEKGNGLYANTAFIPDLTGFWILFVIL